MKNNLTGEVSQFTYDSMGRLTNVPTWGGHSWAYTYDANGNRTSVKKGGTIVQTLTCNADKQLSNSGYTYDKAGRRTGNPEQGSTSWNAFGQSISRMKGSNTGTYTYAGYGQDENIQQKGKGTTKTYLWGRSSKTGIPRWNTRCRRERTRPRESSTMMIKACRSTCCPVAIRSTWCSMAWAACGESLPAEPR